MKQAIDVHKVFAGYFKGVEALAYAVSKNLAEGSICLDVESFRNSVISNDITWQENPFMKENPPVNDMLAEGRFVTHDETETKPFVVFNGKVYLHRYFTYETQIIENIVRLGNNFKIITGGPGTGKTYSVAQNLIKLLSGNIELKIGMAAPTGKAAGRMNEAIRKFASDDRNIIDPSVREKLVSLNAQTIHRLLGYVPVSVFFRYDKKKPLPFDVIIIDEASMIDGALMAKLLSAIGGDTLFYLIGDKDQLASVEAGSVFGDICRAGNSSALLQEKIKLLEKNYRAESADIIEFSKQIISGEISDAYYLNTKDAVTIDTEYKTDLFVGQVELYEDYIREPDPLIALKLLNRLRVLCVTREHDHSVDEANERIAGILKQKINDAELFSPKSGFYHNQPIIITKNDYTLNLSNGDVGLIRKEAVTGLMKAYFEDQDGKLKEYHAGYLNYFETVFAMTIHKSQGSEFDHVVVQLPEKQARKLLTRELLYTAVTRARKRVVVQGTAGVLSHCIENRVMRASGLTERIH